MFSLKNLIPLFCLAFLLISTISFSQNDSDEDGLESEELAKKRMYKNVLKVSIPTLTYERVLDKDKSVNLHLMYFRINAFDTSPALDIPDLSPRNQAFVSAFTLTGEYRMYSTSKYEVAPEGFYFAPFVRYSNIRYNFIGESYSDGTNFFPGVLESKLSGIGIGGQVGIQYKLEDRFTIDWGIIGLGVNFSSLKVKIRSDQPNIDYESFAQIENDDLADEIGLLRNNISYKADGNSISSKKRKVLPIIRTLVTFGVRF